MLPPITYSPSQIVASAPITSPIDVATNIPSQARSVLPPVTSSLSPIVASAPTRSPTVPSTSSVPSPLPEVSSTPSPLSGHCRVHGCDVESHIDDAIESNAALLMISPNGHG